MKIHYLIPATFLLVIGLTGCDKRSAEIDKRIAELELRNNEAVERQRDLEQQIEDQKLAVERDAIERERARIDEERAELERRQGQAAVEQDEALREREEALGKREDKLDRIQETLEEKQDRLKGREQDLTERDRDLAGREALDFEPTEQSVPVGDYGTFYDGLSSYGSWFETPDYGYVWQPAVVREVNWRPYSRGRWVCSDRGWTWVSDEPFGWATYHYGRWALIVGRGWVWVPGSEWAPCWVSWRENDSHIGWAPLPPETMAYRGTNWDSTVDVRFGIAAICFNFVEIRHFGGSLFRHCLPTTANFGWFNKTINITYVHHQNNYVICGGPRYQRISERIGRPLPFYRLEVDQHPRSSRDQAAMRAQVRDGRLKIAAPNLDAGWNEGLRPKQVRGRIETLKVERNGELNSEIIDRVRQNRDERRTKAERAIAELGGPERFEERRSERLQINRREVEGKLPTTESRDVVRKPIPAQRETTNNEGGPKVTPPAKTPSASGPNVTPPPPIPGRSGNGSREGSGQPKTEPRMPETKESRPDAGQGSRPNVVPEPPARRPETAGNRGQSNGGGNGRQPDPSRDTGKEEASRRQQEQAQRQAEQARQEQQENQRQKQQEQAKIRQEQETQRQEEQAKEARKQAMEEQREKAREQQQAREDARRQQQEQQQREMQRQQQEEARQRQQEEARQREQEQERQRRQEEAREQQQREQARQREQEESRQRQQEQARQQQEEQSRQQKQRDDDDPRKRNR